MAKLFTQRIGNWFTLHRAPLNSAETPDYEGGDYDAVLDIHGQIGKDWYSDDKDVDADTFKKTLDSLKGKNVMVSIHSPGGNIWDGYMIHNAIAEHGNVTTKIEGIAASAASVIFQAGKTRVMPKLSMQMMHKNSTITMGNAEEHQAVVDRLKAHDETLAKMYSNRSGKPIEDCRNMMDAETWMDGDQCLAGNMCDKVVDCMPSVSNSLFDLTMFRRVPMTVSNQFGKQKQTPLIMDRTKMIALLNKWGVQVASDATDKWLEDKIAEGKPVVNTAPAPAPAPPTNIVPIPAMTNEDRTLLESLRNERAQYTLREVTRRVDNLVTSDRLPAARRQAVIDSAVKDSTILDTFEAIDPRPPGYAAASTVSVETASIVDIGKAMLKNREPLDACMQLRANYRGKDNPVRKDISNGSIATSKMIRTYVNKFCSGISEDTKGGQEKRAEKIADLCEYIGNHAREFAPISNADAAQGPYGSTTVTSNLQRQVIFSEAMRAFRRQLVPLSAFAHTWNSVPLEGTDVVVVPYYPLFTTGSYRFVAPSGGAGGGGNNTSPGYVFNGTDQAQDKNITIGGVGSAVKTAGVDRAYQAMTWSTYLLRRQPWVDIMKLAVMRTEQLAIDILNDIISAWILKANFGAAVYSNSAAFFQTDTIAQLAGEASKLFWPDNNRNLVINTDFWVTLLQDPALKAYLNIGTTEIIREAKIGGLYKFSETIENPIIPQTSDGNLAGWMSYPSAVLCATSPMMPAPGVMKLLMTYDIVIDDQTGLAFEYRYWGDMVADQDREIVECSYGSGLGETAALRRLVVSGS